MKTKITFILLLLLGNNAFTQTGISGVYCRLAEGVVRNIKKVDKCITFLPNHEFTYFNHYENEKFEEGKYYTRFGFDYFEVGEYGSGTYQISDDTLSLFFASKDSKLKNNFVIYKSLNPSSDSVSIDIELFSAEDNTSLPFAIIIIKDSVDSVITKPQKSISTDFFGRASTTICKSASNICLEIRYINLLTSFIEIDNNYNYKIIGHIVSDESGRIFDEVRKFLILKNKNNILKIKSVKDKHISMFYLKE